MALRSDLVRPASRVIAQTGGGHLCRVEKVPSIYDHRRSHEGADQGQIEPAELRPLRADDEAVRSNGRGIWVLGQPELKDLPLGVLPRTRVEGHDGRSGRYESAGQRQGRRRADVVRVRLEGQAQESDPSSFEAVEESLHRGGDGLERSIVDLQDLPQ